ncbi:6598_t:CDS:2 [Dentiscutata erythropus]|uniref:6598_t:CDS:1 n=1 Tax=Dentiscutata erythropus TaxID=1348616 RepID=A0A9N9CMF7_9GLOM|nr:6598_t:CDS:2 [Dentiscutata erythropus]
MTKIIIIIYATYTHVYQLALEIKKGVESVIHGSNVEIFQIPESFQEQILDQVHEHPKPDIPFVTSEKLADADGLLFGIPAKFGQFPAQFKEFLDSSSQILGKEALNNKFGGIFFSMDTQQSGQEMIAFTAISWLSYHGINFIPLGSGSHEELIGGVPWGAGTIASNDTLRPISEKEKDIAQFQGKKFAEIVMAYVKGRQE